MEKDSSHVLGRIEALSAAVRSMLTSLPHAEDLHAVLRALEARGLKFRGGGRFDFSCDERSGWQVRCWRHDRRGSA